MRNFKILNIIIATVMLFCIQIAKAQLPSSDSAYHLVWQDTFPTWNGYKIDTSKWDQKYSWNQADSIYKEWIIDHYVYKDIAYTKWYKPFMPAPPIPDTWPPDTTIASYNASTYNNALYHSIIMGTNTSVTNQNYQSFWGSDYILLNDGTSVDGNSNVLFNITNCISTWNYYMSSPQSPPASFISKQSRHYTQ
jgi:hypothetical protein